MSSCRLAASSPQVRKDLVMKAMQASIGARIKAGVDL